MAAAMATTIVAQRATQYGTDLGKAIVVQDWSEANKLRRRLELSMTMAASEEFLQEFTFAWAPKAAENVVAAQWLAKAVVAGDYDFLNENYGAVSKKEFAPQIKLLKSMMPAINTVLLGGSGATHLNEQQVRALLRQALLPCSFDYSVTSELFAKSAMDKGKVSSFFNNDVRYMMGAQASAFDGEALFAKNYKPAGVDHFPELNEYGGYYCAPDFPLSLEAGQIPYFISFTDSVTLPKDRSLLFQYEEGCGGYVEFGKDVPIVLYDLKRGVVYTRSSPYLVPETVWQPYTPEQAGDRTYISYLSTQDHTSEHDRALTKYVAACDETTCSGQRCLSAPFLSHVLMGHNKEMQGLLGRIMAGCYQNNPMYATCDHLYAVTPTMFKRDLLPGMLVRADMIAKASDIHSGQGTLMCISQPASPGAIGFFYSGYDEELHVHTMDVGIIASALESTFEPSNALTDAEIVGSVSVFSHWEHERILMFFAGHRPDIYYKMDADELWGDMGEYKEYKDWCGDLERLFISLVGVYSKLYDDEVGNTIHSLGMVYSHKGDYNILDAPTMLQEIHMSDKHRGFLKSQEFVALGNIVFGEYFEDLLRCRSLGSDPGIDMERKDIGKIGSIYNKLSAKFLMRTKADSRKAPAAASSSSSASSSAAGTIAVIKPPVVMTMPNFKEQLLVQKQELRDLEGSPPPAGITDAARKKLEDEHDDGIAGAKQVYEDWWYMFKLDYRKKKTELNEQQEAAIIDGANTDEEERIEAELKQLNKSFKATRDEHMKSTEETIAKIEADFELKLKNAVNTEAIEAHKAKCAAKLKAIQELEKRVLDLDRQGVREDFRRQLTGVVGDLKECFSKLRSLQDRGEDDSDVIMDADTLEQCEKYMAATALQATILIARKYPSVLERAKPRVAVEPLEVVDIAGSDEDDDEEEDTPPPLPPKPVSRKRKERAASSGIAAAVVAASPRSYQSSSSSSRRRAAHGGGRKKKQFRTGAPGAAASSSSSSSSAAAAASSADRHRS